MKFNQAITAIENCACAWVEAGKSIRDLTLSESIQARNQQAKDREPLPSSEIPGIRYEMPLGAKDAAMRYELVKAASVFVSEQA